MLGTRVTFPGTAEVEGRLPDHSVVSATCKGNAGSTKATANTASPTRRTKLSGTFGRVDRALIANGLKPAQARALLVADLRAVLR